MSLLSDVTFCDSEVENIHGHIDCSSAGFFDRTVFVPAFRRSARYNVGLHNVTRATRSWLARLLIANLLCRSHGRRFSLAYIA